jgi:cobalt-zinc-cadmium efflux system outer membrane protein
MRTRATFMLIWFAGCVQSRPQLLNGHVRDDLATRAGQPAESPDRTIPEGVSIDDGLDADEAVAIALWNNAAFQEALAELGFSRAEVVQAGLLANPVLSVLFPLGPKQLEFTATFPLEALWLRPRRVELAETEPKRVAERLVQNRLDLIRDVRVAFAELERSDKRVRLAREAAELSGRLAELADARLRAGDASPFEISTARIDAQRAREDLTRLRHDAAIARERLRALLGPALPDGDFKIVESQQGDLELGVEPAALELREFTKSSTQAPGPARLEHRPKQASTQGSGVRISDLEKLSLTCSMVSTPPNLKFVHPTPPVGERGPSVQQLVQDALAARPDLRAAELAVDAACQRVRLAILEFLSVAALADANDGGTKGFEMGPGMQVTLPIFRRNDGAVARAEAEVTRAVRQLNTVHDRIVLEVREAHARYEQATEQLRIWQAEIVPSTEEAVAQAQAAFEHGEASLVAVLEATRQLLDARVCTVESAAARRRAWAELERSVGRRLTPHDTLSACSRSASDAEEQTW